MFIGLWLSVILGLGFTADHILDAKGDTLPVIGVIIGALLIFSGMRISFRIFANII